MNLIISFTQTEELLTATSSQMGIAPDDLIRQLAIKYLPPLLTSADDELDSKLRSWQQQDGTPLMPDVSADALYAQWAEEDSQMTDEERDAEDALWADIETGMNATNSLRLRQLSSS